ncbi:MAG: LysR family transcriptional regulator [Nannocystaceae bacterium]|nr:LysR family transcriptional regulator [Nannocystaceae bacterium]
MTKASRTRDRDAIATAGLAAAPWDDVRVLLAVLRAGSFTKAAEALGTDQSTVSRRIAGLEQVLGLPLFERTRRAPLPTETALRLREACERVDVEMARFADEAAGAHDRAVQGRVRVATTEEVAIHVLVPRVLPALRREHPGLHVDLLTGYRAADLAAREAEIAIRFFRTERGDLVGRRIARWPTTVLAARRSARALRGRPLRELEWISVELAGLATPESAWLQAHIDRPPAMICSSYQVQLAAIRAGIGVGIGPRLYAELDPDFVALVEPDARLPLLDVHLVTRRAIRGLPRVDAVMTALEQALTAL